MKIAFLNGFGQSQIAPAVWRRADLAIRYRLPAVSMFGTFARIGALMAYTVPAEDIIPSAAFIVAKILKGAGPADIPIQRPTRFSLIVNLKTAKALGITVPPSLLARADKVIE